MVRKKAFGIFGGFLAVMLVFTLISRAVSGAAMARVETVKLSTGTIDHKVSGSGKVEAGKEVAVYTEGGQRVKEICVQEGQSVEQGEILFLLDLERLEEQILAARQELEKIRLQDEDAQSSRESQQDARALAKKRAAEDYDQAVSKGDADVAKAKADWDAAEWALQEFLRNNPRPAGIVGAAYSGGTSAYAAIRTGAVNIINGLENQEKGSQGQENQTKGSQSQENQAEEQRALQGQADPNEKQEPEGQGIQSEHKGIQGQASQNGNQGSQGQASQNENQGSRGLENQEGGNQGSQSQENQEGRNQGSRGQENQEGGKQESQSRENQEGRNQGSRGQENQEGGKQESQSRENQKEGNQGSQSQEDQKDENQGSQGQDNQSQGDGAAEWDAQKSQLEQSVAEAKAAYEAAVSARTDSIRTAARAVEDAAAAAPTDSTAAQNEILKKQQELSLSKLQKLQKSGGKVAAPVSGMVTEVAVTTGDFTTEGTAVRLADTSQGNRLVASVSKSNEAYVQKGGQVTISPSGSKDKLKDYTISNVSVNKEDDTLLDVSIALPKGVLEPGASAEIEIVKKSAQFSSVIPIQALHEEQTGYYVLILREQQGVMGQELVAERMDVRVLDKNGTNAALEEGLLTGEQEIISTASRSIEDGSRVRREE